MTFISRRDLLKRAAAVGAAVPGARGLQPSDLLGTPPAAERPAKAVALDASDAAALQPSRLREPLETLTAGEMGILYAIVARLIPSDAKRPGAVAERARPHH